jgi:hypothetical protein
MYSGTWATRRRGSGRGALSIHTLVRHLRVSWERRLVLAPSNTTGGPALIGDDSPTPIAGERLGVEQLELVLGFSMGARRAYEWAVCFPGACGAWPVFAGFARTTAARPAGGASAEALQTGGTKQRAHFRAAPGCRRALSEEDGEARVLSRSTTS